jgi:hypothetical protein
MAHLLVTQLRFARHEFLRGMEGVTEPEALVRLGSMNCLSWFVGHLASAENKWWILFALNGTSGLWAACIHTSFGRDVGRLAPYYP